MLLTIFLLIMRGVVESFQEIKTWNANTNFDNSRNWPKGRLPCSKDRVIFPEDARVVVYVPNSASFLEMVLPLRGEFIFEEGANLLGNGLFTERGCKGEDVNFIVNSDSWFDPDKWNLTLTYAHPSDETSVKNQAVPHAFRIPCQTDLVVFPEDKSFTVNMEETPITIGGVEINGVKYPNELFQAILARKEGYLLFQGSPRISVSGQGCEDVSGCVCGNDEKDVLTKICSHVSCPTLECSDPVRPAGQCCPICGSFLLMQCEEDFEVNRFGNVLKSQVSKVQYKDVHWFAVKTKDHLIQTVFIDAGSYKGDANDLVENLYQQLKRDIRESNSNRLKSVDMYSSKNWLSGVPSHSQYTRRGLSSAGTAAVVIIIICIVCAASAWYIYRKRRIPGFSFARFDLHSSKIELELGTTPHDVLSPDNGCSAIDEQPVADSGTVSKAFDNPVYGKAQTSDECEVLREKEVSGIQDISAEENIVENPMFMMFEPTKSEEQSLTQ